MISSKELAADLIKKALAGKLGLDELYSKWPEELEGGVWDEIFDDLVSVVEHFPYKILPNTPDYDMWKQSINYKRLASFLDLHPK